MYLRQAALLILFLEAVLTLTVISHLGFFGALLLWAAGAVAGSLILQSRGLSSLSKAQTFYGNGMMPASSIYESLCFVAAGALLILPGFLSDLIALALLIPPIRTLLRRKSGKLFNLKEPPLRDGDIIEGAYVRVEEEQSVIDLKPPQT